jgi:hypothetical protein
VVPLRATAYSPAEGGAFEVEMSNYEQIGDGAVQTTVEDLLLWNANLDNPRVGGQEIVEFLREGGFKHFPCLVPRWAIAGGDIYGNSPGMEALGDIKQLQHEQLRKAQVIDYQTKPPASGADAYKNRDVDTLPGGIYS